MSHPNMSHSKWLSLFLLVSSILIFGPQAARACSCGPSPTVLDAYDASDVVVIVKVLSVEKVENEAKESRYVDGVRSTKVTVERVFKGKLKIGDEMTFGQGGGADCIWTFSEKDIGQEVLFYLKALEKNPKVWLGFGCGRSTGVGAAGDDLLYLENMAKVRGKTRISGTLKSMQSDDLSFAGRKVRIIGKDKTYEVKTNRDGVYELYDAPAGKYLIEPEPPLGWKVDYFWLQYSPNFVGDRDDNNSKPAKQFPIVLENKKHASLDIYFVIDNAVRGKVYDPNGKPMADVCLNLIPVEDKESSLYKADCTEEEGAYKIDEIPPGSYILAINKNGKVSSSEPFRTFYYPDVSDPDKAAVLTVSEGQFLNDIDIHVPHTEETITIEGRFLYADGKPVVDEYVEFKADNAGADVEGEARAKTDANGRFSIKVLKGLKGQLYGAMYSYIGEFENCPKLEAVIKKSGKSMDEIKTPALALKAEHDLYEVVLKYPFPGCKKSE